MKTERYLCVYAHRDPPGGLVGGTRAYQEISPIMVYIKNLPGIYLTIFTITGDHS